MTGRRFWIGAFWRHSGCHVWDRARFRPRAASRTRRYIRPLPSTRSQHVNTLMRRYFRLQTLGRLTLTVVDGETESLTGIRPRHLAVLTVIALSTRPISRDALVEMFWGGEDETRARHSLSNALSGLRGALGADALTSRRDHIALAEDSRVEVDTAQFTAAFEAGDDSRAVALYGGPFLDAVHVPDAPEFDDWGGRERAKLERRFAEACERYVARLERAG